MRFRKLSSYKIHEVIKKKNHLWREETVQQRLPTSGTEASTNSALMR